VSLGDSLYYFFISAHVCNGNATRSGCRNLKHASSETAYSDPI